MKKHHKRFKEIYPVFSPIKCSVCKKMIQKEPGIFDKDTQSYYHKSCANKTEGTR